MIIITIIIYYFTFSASINSCKVNVNALYNYSCIHLLSFEMHLFPVDSLQAKTTQTTTTSIEMCFCARGE